MFTFIGEFRNGEKHGGGKQYYQNGKIKFEGIWKLDKFYNVTRYDKNGNIDGKNVNGKWNYFTPLKPTNRVLYGRYENGVWGWYKSGNEKKDTKYVGEWKNGKKMDKE